MVCPHTDEDLDELLDVWYQASLVAHSFLTDEFLTTERRRVPEHWLPMAETMVYATEGRLVGFLVQRRTSPGR